MILTHTGDTVTVRCPAKLNLFLETRGLRPDGYHELETVMQAVTLYDNTVMRRVPEDRIEFRCSDPQLPDGAGNLAWQAADLLRREAELREGVSITLEKRIPAGAGLGGGSSDAAGVLAGMNELFHLGLDRKHLCSLAANLGSDVPFFVYGGTALCRGRGEQITPVPAGFVGHYVIYCPHVAVPTPLVYRNLARLGLTSGDRSASFVLDSLARGDTIAARASLFNRLEEAAVSLVPEVGEARRTLTAAAGLAALVSGSGAAVYVLLDSEAHAREVAQRAGEMGVGQVFVVRTETAHREAC